MNSLLSIEETVFRRQVAVQRQNLLQICRLTVKTLIEKMQSDDEGEESEELVNFIAVLEHILMFQMKQRRWYKTGEMQHYWPFIRATCGQLPGNGIHTIESIENIRSNCCKGRAWIRLSLMEKRLHEYLGVAQEHKLIKAFYKDTAIIGSEDGSMLIGLLLGLTTLDFSFCLKADSLAYPGILAIDFAKYIDYTESDEPERGDNEADHVISSEGDEYVNVRETQTSYEILQQRYHNMAEQKSYVEEMLRVRTTQLQKSLNQSDNLLVAMKKTKDETRVEVHQLEDIILELQSQLGNLQEQNRRHLSEIETLRDQNKSLNYNATVKYDRLMQEMATPSEVTQDNIEPVENEPKWEMENHQTKVIREDMSSLIPLTGSIVSIPDDAGLSNVGLSNAGLSNAGLSNAGLSNVGAQQFELDTLNKSEQFSPTSDCKVFELVNIEHGAETKTDDYSSDSCLSSNGNFEVVSKSQVEDAEMEDVELQAPL